jgi:hypothetical protein
MDRLNSLAQKYQLVGRNFLGWGRPVIAKIWLSVVIFLR